MDWMEVMRARHSVRSYRDKPIEEEKVRALEEEIAAIPAASGLAVRLLTEEPGAFAGDAPRYGAFRGCRNYFALVGPRDAEEAVGYWGERLVLRAQALGLNTCWVVLTYRKGKVPVTLRPGEKLHAVIALGYGQTQGTPHRSKPTEALAACAPDDPAWYRAGVEAALLAPTAVNQQRFFLSREGETVTAKARPAFHSAMDLGIVKYHFELAAGKENFRWNGKEERP